MYSVRMDICSAVIVCGCTWQPPKTRPARRAVYIENDGIRNKMAEQVAKKLSGLNDIDLEAKMKASPEHVLNEHKKVMATMTRS